MSSSAAEAGTSASGGEAGSAARGKRAGLDTDAAASVVASRLLPFQRQLVADLCATRDSLLILAPGLGLSAIGSALLSCVCTPDALVLLLNATKEDERALSDDTELNDALGGAAKALKSLSADVPAQARQGIYKQGGLVAVTAQCAVVDMINKRMPTKLVAGIVVYNAHELTRTSNDAFALTLFREQNPHGFIKAISDNPGIANAGVGPLQQLMQSLKLRDVSLVPRFHEMVNTDLEKAPPGRKKARKVDVTEFYVEPTDKMKEIQVALADAMEKTLAEIRRSNTNLDLEDLTVENALFDEFNRIVRAQLEPVWHRVGPRVKSLLNDLKDLRDLQIELLELDCVVFLHTLERIREANTTDALTGAPRVHRSPWLEDDCAQVVFANARARVFLPAPNAAATSSSSGDKTDKGKGKQSQIEEDDEDERMLREIEEMEGLDDDAPRARRRTPPKPARPLSEAWLPPGYVSVLEEQPKWGLLADVLREIENEMHFAPVDPFQKTTNTVLIMTRTAQTAKTLQDYLCSPDPVHLKASFSGGDADGIRVTDELSASEQKVMRDSRAKSFLQSRLRQYFIWLQSAGKLARNLRTTSATATTSGGGGAMPQRPGQPQQAAGRKSDDNIVLSAALKRKTELANSANGAPGSPSAGGIPRAGAPPNKRRRVRGGSLAALGGGDRATPQPGAGGDGKAVGGKVHADIADAERFVQLVDELEKDAENGGAADAVLNGEPVNGASVIDYDKMVDDFDEALFADSFGLLSNEELVIVRPYAGDDDDRVLEELRPKYIIMYDPDPTFVKRVEVFRAMHDGLATRVYFLMYGNSIEEQRYLRKLRNEKSAFERLIHERGVMVIPHEAERRPGDEGETEFLRTFNTRVGGGQRSATAEPRRVIVDMREFRSQLPILLHKAGFDIVPLTISVGDYVITPDMVVERKSVPDLIQSFNSGRLYQQCELMTTHYKQPLLLIDFDERKSFTLANYAEARSTRFEPRGKPSAGQQTSDRPNETDLRAKLVLLTLTFPKLRILWASSPSEAVEILADLKQNRPEPDPEAALSTGSEDTGVKGEAEAGFNQAAQEMLRSLPGVTSRNYRFIMSKVDSMDELCALPLKDLQDLIGVEAGHSLHRFLTRDMRVSGES